ncbi:MAG: hypothetical protein RSP_21160 [Rhodanobacter sp.]
MRLPHPRHPSLRLLGAIITCSAVVQTAVATAPAALQGRWEVIQVAVDHRDQNHWQYFPDDPRLLGRQLVVDDAGIRLDDGSRSCNSPSFAALPAGKLQRFISTRFPRPASFDTPTQPTLADFDIALPDTTVSPLQIRCATEASPWNGAWLVATAAHHLLTNYDGSGYVLVLRRLGTHEPIRASFACAKAHNASEQTICTSATLAGYDRSVAAAYRFALQRSGGDTDSLRQAQRKWIESRDACGTDADCLAASMRNRTDQLMQQ